MMSSSLGGNMASEGDPQAREDTWMAEECRMAPLPPHEWHDGRCIYCDEEERETRSTDDDVHEKGTVVARETSAPAKPTVGTNEGTGLEGRSGKPDAAEPLLPATSSVSPMVEALGPVAWLEQAESLSPRADPPTSDGEVSMHPIQDVIELPDKHPLRVRAEKAEAERNQLRAALVGLVGVDSREELEQLEVAMRLMPAPAADKAATLDAIHALIATCKEDS